MGCFDRLLDEFQVGFEVGFGHVAGLGCFVVVHVLRAGLSGCVFFKKQTCNTACYCNIDPF